MNLTEAYKRRLCELAGINKNWMPEYFYHFTPTKNVSNILKNGLIPKYKPNREYFKNEFTSNAIYLTNTPLIDSANLPNEMRGFEVSQPLTILRINSSYLDQNLFIVDDDYYSIYMVDDETIENMGKEIRSPDRILDSLSKETGAAYEGKIPKEAITIYKSLKENLNESFNIEKYKTFDSLSDEDLRDIGRWGLMGDYSASGAWDCADWKEERIEEAIQCAVDDFKNALSDSYPQGLRDFPSEAILYRFIVLSNEDQLNKNNLGRSWFADIKRKDDPDFFQQLHHLKVGWLEKGKKLYLISAKILIEKISIPRTLWQRSLSDLENEVVLKDDNGIKVLKINQI